jgi:hypothetical protein
MKWEYIKAGNKVIARIGRHERFGWCWEFIGRCDHHWISGSKADAVQRCRKEYERQAKVLSDLAREMQQNLREDFVVIEDKKGEL